MNTIPDLARTLKISERSASYHFSVYAPLAALDLTRQADQTILIPDDHFRRIAVLYELSQRHALPFAGTTRMLLNFPVELIHQTITSFVSPALRDPQQRTEFMATLNAGRALLGDAPFPPLPPSQDQGAELLTRLGKLSLDFDDLRREVNAAMTGPSGSVKVAGPKRGEES